MNKKLNFRKRLYCSVVAILSLFAVGSNSLYAANNSGSEGIPIDVNNSQRNAQEVKVGDKAPDFTVTKDGKSIKLANLVDRVIVVVFSSTSAESRKVISDMARLEEKYKGGDVAFINIPIDQYTDIATAYGISSTPALCAIDLNGEIYKIDYDNIDLDQELKEIFPTP